MKPSLYFPSSFQFPRLHTCTASPATSLWSGYEGRKPFRQQEDETGMKEDEDAAVLFKHFENFIVTPIRPSACSVLLCSARSAPRCHSNVVYVIEFLIAVCLCLLEVGRRIHTLHTHTWHEKFSSRIHATRLSPNAPLLWHLSQEFPGHLYKVATNGDSGSFVLILSLALLDGNLAPATLGVMSSG